MFVKTRQEEKVIKCDAVLTLLSLFMLYGFKLYMQDINQYRQKYSSQDFAQQVLLLQV